MKNRGITKRLFAFALAGSLCLSSALAVEGSTGSMENFKPSRNYNEQFTDVKPTDWYYDAVKFCYENNLMNGTSESTFSPDTYMTVMVVTTVCARIHSIYYGGNGIIGDVKSAYQYMENNGISPVYADASPEGCYRHNAFGTIGSILPEHEYTPINYIEDIPDLAAGTLGYNESLRMYNAGIITGTDKYGSLSPNKGMNRAELATVIYRLLNPDKRIQFTVEPYPQQAAIHGVVDREFNTCKNMGIVAAKYPEIIDTTYSDVWSLNYIDMVNDVDGPSEYPFNLKIYNQSYDNNVGYLVEHRLEVGEGSEKQYELVYALLKDVTENPDAIYAYIKEQENVVLKGWAEKTPDVIRAYLDSHEYKTVRIGNVNFTWGSECNSFTIEKIGNL
ncbi:S-layer homology domain-containing protein [Butyricicoccus faecihominis]|uniref:S-layer homology domain-containing protein n=1 Tax=Butyricicoccus faecihominis TaxID=1712515 RepID=UPI0024797009|nr:S-layer homology domain-containing protein [Butyricicoccus faecihominis]MCQ5129580.1 S-layer homology domain-containing protein [Butyricicoccus faecihominis]